MIKCTFVTQILAVPTASLAANKLTYNDEERARERKSQQKVTQSSTIDPEGTCGPIGLENSALT